MQACHKGVSNHFEVAYMRNMKDIETFNLPLNRKYSEITHENVLTLTLIGMRQEGFTPLIIFGLEFFS